MRKALISLLLIVSFAVAEEASKDSMLVKIETKNLLLTVVSWPFVYIVQPTVEFLMYPVIPPLLYVSRENLIERGQKLITYGKNGQIMSYPLINAKVGSQANIGFAYWHSDIILDKDNIFFSPHLYINGDWDIAMRYKKSRILGTSFYSGLRASYMEYAESVFKDMSGVEHPFADSSFFLHGHFGFGLAGDWGLEFGAATNFYRFDIPKLKDTIVEVEGSYAYNRGIYRDYNIYPLSLSLLYNSLDEPYAATRGQKFSFSYSYAPVSSYNGSSDHNYHVVESRFINYALLGKRSYAMTVAESNINRERLKNLSFKEAIEMFNPINVKEEILDRRVLITQLKARYMIEENENKAPFIAMGKLGGNFPLRAYGDGSFTAPLVMGISNEYRWPVDRFADALIFNEYGIFSEDFSSLSISNIRNSYGFGFRIRTSRFFILRFALAFHGLHGVALILTTRPEYD